MKHLLTVAAVATALALSACGSPSDDPDMRTPSDTDASVDQGIAEGEPNPSTPAGPDGETSMPAPDEDERPLSSEPGGDTRAVAGFWDASLPLEDDRYFVIAPNGLWTEYFRMYDDEVARNCFARSETQTLTPEDPATNAYSLADGRQLTLVTDASGDTLTVDVAAEGRTDEWPAVVGRMPEDLPLCSEQ